MKTLLAILALFAPVSVYAHTRWFAEGEIMPLVTDEPTMLYMSVWALVAILIVAVGIMLERKQWLQLGFLEPTKPHAFMRAASTFAMVAGAFFIIAGTHEYLFSPNLSLESGVPMLLIVAQIIVGLAYLIGIAPRMASLVLLLLWGSGMYVAGVEPLLENIWVLSTALFVLIMGNDYFSIFSFSVLREHVAHYKSYALSLLRLGTGATLLILGFSEKLLRPELGINFLVQHPWNFMPMLGFSQYSDYLFVLSAGSVEALFGLIFILGVVTRLNALVLAIVFSIPMFILGPIELAGHLPHFAAVVLLLLFGNGGHFLLVPPREEVPRQEARHIA